MALWDTSRSLTPSRLLPSSAGNMQTGVVEKMRAAGSSVPERPLIENSRKENRSGLDVRQAVRGVPPFTRWGSPPGVALLSQSGGQSPLNDLGESAGRVPPEVAVQPQVTLDSAVSPQGEESPGRFKRSPPSSSKKDSESEQTSRAGKTGATGTRQGRPGAGAEGEDQQPPSSASESNSAAPCLSLLTALRDAQRACGATIRQLRRAQQDIIDAGEAASRLITQHPGGGGDLSTSSFSVLSDACWTSARSPGKKSLVRTHSSSSLSSPVSKDKERKTEGLSFFSKENKREESSRDSSPRSPARKKRRDRQDLLGIPQGSVCWRQQKILLVALQKQLEEVSSYASALLQLEHHIQATASSFVVPHPPGVLDEQNASTSPSAAAVAAAAAAVAAAQACPPPPSPLPPAHTSLPLSESRSTIQEEENEMKQLLDVLEAGCLLPQQSDGEESADLVMKAKARATAASNALRDHLTLLAERLSANQSTITRRATFLSRWGELFIEAAAEIEIHLDEVAPLVKKGRSWEKQIDAELLGQEKEIQVLHDKLQATKKIADQMSSRLKQKRHQFLLAIQDWTTEKRLHQLNKSDRMRQLNTRIDALDRQIRGLAAFSPLFIVERTPKYLTLQYKPMGSTTDYEISIEGLELLLEAQEPHAYKISSFFSVRVAPQLVWLEERLERAIRNYFSTICTLQRPALSSDSPENGAACPGNQGIGSGRRPYTPTSGLDSGAAVAQSRRTIYDFAPYSVAQQRELGWGAGPNSSTPGTKRGRDFPLEEEAEGSNPRTLAESRTDTQPKRKSFVSEKGHARKKQVKIFTEHIAAIVLKTLTTAFGSTETPNTRPC